MLFRRGVTAAGIAAVLLLPACARAPRDARANVVLVSIDTLRADALGCGGDPRGTSPHIDRIARRGTYFAHCIAQASATLPSHRSLFQSLPASRTSDGSPMLAEVLRDAGWSTVAWTGGGNLAGSLGFDRGFDVWEESAEGLGWSVERLAAWLAGERPPGPFFAFLHGYDVHVPYDPPPPLDRLYDPHYAGPVRGADTRALCRAIRRLGDWQSYTGTTELAAADRAHLVALYDGGVRAADLRIGALARQLDEHDLAARTVVVLVSDHGEEFWEHGSVLHSHTVYRELVHVPLVIRTGDPAHAGRLAGTTVRNLDVAPTLMDLLGLSPVPDHFGESLRPLLEGRGGSPRPAVAEMVRWKTLVDWPWKVITGPNVPPALYDIAADPGETASVASRDPARVAALMTELAATVAGVAVEELAGDAMSREQRERLRALGYVD